MQFGSIITIASQEDLTGKQHALSPALALAQSWEANTQRTHHLDRRHPVFAVDARHVSREGTADRKVPRHLTTKVRTIGRRSVTDVGFPGHPIHRRFLSLELWTRGRVSPRRALDEGVSFSLYPAAQQREGCLYLSRQCHGRRLHVRFRRRRILSAQNPHREFRGHPAPSDRQHQRRPDAVSAWRRRPSENRRGGDGSALQRSGGGDGSGGAAKESVQRFLLGRREVGLPGREIPAAHHVRAGGLWPSGRHRQDDLLEDDIRRQICPSVRGTQRV